MAGIIRKRNDSQNSNNGYNHQQFSKSETMISFCHDETFTPLESPAIYGLNNIE
jgi:hypothetical protein